LLYDTILIMQNKFVKTILYIAFSAMLVMAGYVIFVSRHMISNRYYFIITAAAFLLVCAAFAVILFMGKVRGKKRVKLMIIICIVLIGFQVITLPAVNLWSQTLPAWPRGTIYQFPKTSNSIAQNEVGLMMRYYLNGKTLYANEDYPINSHNGFLFITDEYKFVQTNYPVLSEDEGESFHSEYNKTLQTINVQENTKLHLPSFKICISIYTDELVLLTDEKGNWYFMSLDLYEEVFGE